MVTGGVVTSEVLRDSNHRVMLLLGNSSYLVFTLRVRLCTMPVQTFQIARKDSDSSKKSTNIEDIPVIMCEVE